MLEVFFKSKLIHSLRIPRCFTRSADFSVCPQQWCRREQSCASVVRCNGAPQSWTEIWGGFQAARLVQCGRLILFCLGQAEGSCGCSNVAGGWGHGPWKCTESSSSRKPEQAWTGVKELSWHRRPPGSRPRENLWWAGKGTVAWEADRGKAEDGGKLAHSVEELPVGYSQWQERESVAFVAEMHSGWNIGARMLGDQ